MIDVHYWPTPNGWKVTIMLEECGLDYQIKPVDIGGGDQFKPEFLRLSPNNRMPAIVDHEPLGGDAPVAIFESGAILEYLADKNRAVPAEVRARALPGAAMGALANGQSWPMMGNANHFKNYAKNIVEDPAQLEYGAKRFVGEVDRLSGVMDAQLAVHPFLAGGDYSIADIITWPWAMLMGRLIDENVWDGFPNLKRWVEELAARPAVDKGYHVGRELAKRELTEEEEKARRELLFNQTNDKVRKAREEAAKAAS